MISQDTVAYAKVKLEELLAFFGVNAEVKVSEEDERVRLDVETPDSARLIGYHGETLRALQYLLNQIVLTHTGERPKLSLDIAGYKKGRLETIAAKAKAKAEEVLKTGHSQSIGPLNAAERRAVHMAAGEFSELETESVGEEPQRRVVIKKKDDTNQPTA